MTRAHTQYYQLLVFLHVDILEGGVSGYTIMISFLDQFSVS